MAFFVLLLTLWVGLWLLSRIAFRQELASNKHKGRIAAAIAFVGIGISHLSSPEKVEYMIAGWLPFSHELVIFSGLAEIAGGVGLLIPRVRRRAAWGLILLLLLIFPANINVAIHQLPPPGGLPASPWYTWSRLLFQPCYIAWIWWSSLRSKRNLENRV